MQIQPFNHTDADYAALIALTKLLDPELHLTIDLLRAEEAEFTARNQVTRVLGLVGQEVVASGLYWQSTQASTEPYHFSLSVHPAYQASDLPAQLHQYLLDCIAQAHPTAIVSQAKEDDHYRTRLLEASDFVLKMRFPRSRLDVTGVDPAAYADRRAQLAAEGIDFVTLADVMQADPNWQRHIWQLFTIIEQDVPAPEGVTTTSFEEYAEYYTADWFLPASWTIAVDTTQTGAARYVGMCVVNTMPSRPDSLFAGITGVVPLYRRRKIALILKVCSAAYAQQQGYRYIHTDNEENNPMYTLNLQLGFAPLPALVYYKKEGRA